ncbi:MAG: hypothetical protein DWI03_01260 [Planctomycetota bacterium]|jgi:hypothetical protein|nr:MAG: hypothetical protein DWI03_01260 [Planctomycetota bacterium]
MARRTTIDKLLRERMRLQEEIAATREKYGRPSAVQLSRLRWYDQQLADAERSTTLRVGVTLRELWSRLRRRGSRVPVLR